MVRRAVFTTAYSSCECVIIFIFLRGRFPRFGLFIIFFVVMVLSFFFLSWRSRCRLQTPHASLIEESVDVQAWRQMHLHSRIHVVSVVIVQSVKKKKVKLWWWQWFNKIRRCSEREWMLWWLSQAINSILLTRLLCSFCPWQVLYYICNITHSFERRSRNRTSLTVICLHSHGQSGHTSVTSHFCKGWSSCHLFSIFKNLHKNKKILQKIKDQKRKKEQRQILNPSDIPKTLQSIKEAWFQLWYQWI